MTSKRSRGLLVALLALPASWAMAPAAQAYSCPGQPVEVYIERADVVLVGTARSGSRAPWSWVVGARAEVEVERYLKGTGPEVVTVTSTAPFPFGLGYRATGWPENRIGQRGVLFLAGSGERYRDDICGGSRWTYPPAPEQLTAFLADVEAVTGPGSPPEPGRASALPIAVPVGGVLLALAVGGMAYAGWYRRRRRVAQDAGDLEKPED